MSKGHCKCKSQECEECPEWIFTFADLVMLMMGFFVILWVLKPAPGKQNEQELDPKWLEIVAKIRAEFGYIPDPESKDPVDMLMLMKKIEQLQLPLKGPGAGGETKTKRQGAEGTDPEVTTIRPGKHALVGGRLLYNVGDAKLSTNTIHQLDEIAGLIRGHRNIFLIKGHTSLDDFTDGTTPQQKMDLSLRRAQAVADYLTSHGIDADILRVEGCSTFEPVVQRTYTIDAQAQNRRVEIESTATLVEDRQDHTARPARLDDSGQETLSQADH